MTKSRQDMPAIISGYFTGSKEDGEFEWASGDAGSSSLSETTTTANTMGLLARLRSRKRGRHQDDASVSSATPTDEPRAATAERERETQSARDPNVPQYTEMEKQVLALRRANPRVLLLFECGYRMRVFDDDAETCAHVLGLRPHRYRYFMQTSVPVHRTLHHTRRLVLAGYKVGIVRQLTTVAMRAMSTDPRVKARPLERDVVEIYTRATVPAPTETEQMQRPPGEAIAEDDDDEVWDEEGVGPDGDEFDDETQEIGQWEGSRHILAVVEAIPASTLFFTQRTHDMMDKSMIPSRLQIGVFSHDIHTGESNADEFEDDGSRHRFRELLSIIEPVEILLPEGGLSTPTMQVLREFTEHRRVERENTTIAAIRLEHVPSGTFTMPQTRAGPVHVAIQVPALSQSCLMALSMYLKSMHIEGIPEISQFQIAIDLTGYQQKCPTVRMSPGAVEELGVAKSMMSSPHSLFGILNNTTTPFGERRLKMWVRQPLASFKDLRTRQAAVAWLANRSQSGDGSEVLEDLLDILPTARLLERHIQLVHIRKATMSTVIDLTNAILSMECRLTRLRSRVEQPDVCTLSAGDYGVSLVCSILSEFPSLTSNISSISKFFCHRQTLGTAHEMSAEWFHHIDVYVALQHLQDEETQIDIRLRQILESYRQTLNVPSLSFTSAYVGGGKFSENLISVDKADMDRIPTDWCLISATSKHLKYYPPQVLDIQARLNAIKEQKNCLIQQAWRDLQELIDSTIYARGMMQVDMLATLDALCSLATVARQHPEYTLPIVIDTTTKKVKSITIQRGRHPILDHFNGSIRVIANDFSISTNPQTGKSIVVTGPNMGGKSTFLRMIGLLTVMAHVGSFVPAEKMSFTVVDSVITLMQRPGGLPRVSRGWLTAGNEELQTICSISKLATRKSLVLLDEVGFGLTSSQAFAAAVGIVEYLVRSVRCQCVLATHSSEVVQQLLKTLKTDCDHAQMKHMDLDRESTEDNAVVFQYESGVPSRPQSFAFHAAAAAGLPQSIIDLARILQHRKSEETILYN